MDRQMHLNKADGLYTHTGKYTYMQTCHIKRHISLTSIPEESTEAEGARTGWEAAVERTGRGIT